MSNAATHRRPGPTMARQRPRIGRRWPFAATGAAVLAVAVALAAAVTAPGDTTSVAAGSPSVRTGETNAMGMPVIATPGAASGQAEAAGIVVTGADWDMGRVPLNVAVRPRWTLQNTGRAAVTLGEPKAEVRTGCCPGPLELGRRSLAPGESTTLTFELSMHPGMDGPHDLAVHVPVLPEGRAATHLTLGVTGDFR
jgi:hypothetical protein